jgi:hypothetical protein
VEDKQQVLESNDNYWNIWIIKRQSRSYEMLPGKPLVHRTRTEERRGADTTVTFSEEKVHSK